MNSVNRICHIFLTAGFKPEDHIPHFGSVLSGVNYLRRDFTYVSIVSYEGEFCEAVYEVYFASKNTRAPKGRDTKGKDVKYSDFQLRGFVPVEMHLLRTEEEIMKILDSLSH